MPIPVWALKNGGQAEAIAKSIETCLNVKTPIISVVIGEGGSGGAIAIAAADRIYMLENSIYSVISPEGCASILWRSADHAQEAAAALKLTAQDIYDLKLIDGIIKEPVGGAHRMKEKKQLSVYKNKFQRLSANSHRGMVINLFKTAAKNSWPLVAPALKTKS